MPTDLNKLEQEFSQAWRSGNSPKIEDYIGDLEKTLQADALGALLSVEVAIRLEQQEHVTAEDYLRRFAGHDATISRICSKSQLELITLSHEQSTSSSRESLNTIDLGVRNTPSGRLNIRCPSCHEPVIVSVDAPLTDLTCICCGIQFSLIDDSQDSPLSFPLETLGHFELIERLGFGAFGTVWKARDKELDRIVAIKIPRTGVMAGDEQEKFLREARASAHLHHPNIVSVHEVGREGSSIFIVSDFVRGMTLADWLKEQRPTWRETAEICIKIAEALHYAHENGVIHRDLKPANIMIDPNSQPHLMDFGLARREVGEVTLTMDGQLLGTPAYMSPEQAQGKAHQADRRTDLYSMGVILYEFLTGEHPFRGNLRMLLYQAIHDDPPGLRKLNSSIPQDLETIALKCLEKSPASRFPTAKHLADELDRYLKGIPILSRPISRMNRLWRLCRRHSAVASLLGTLAIVILGSFVIVSWQLYALVHARRAQTISEVNSLISAAPEVLPDKVSSFNLDDPEVVRFLKDQLLSEDPHIRLRASVALAPTDPSLFENIVGGILNVPLSEFAALQEILKALPDGRTEFLQPVSKFNKDLLAVLKNGEADPEQRLKAAALLRQTDDIKGYQDFIVDQLLFQSSSNPQALSYYVEMFRQSSPVLVKSFEDVFQDKLAPPSNRTAAAIFLAEYITNQPAELSRLMVGSTAEQFTVLSKGLQKSDLTEVRATFRRFLYKQIDKKSWQSKLPGIDQGCLADEQAVQAANAAIALVHYSSVSEATNLLKTCNDPAVRSQLIDRLSKLNAPPDFLIDLLSSEADGRARYSALLSLGGYRQSVLKRVSPDIVNKIWDVYRLDSDGAVHSASRFLLSNCFRERDILDKVDEELSISMTTAMQWKITPALFTMIKFQLPISLSDTNQDGSHRFWISSTEITAGQLEEFSQPWLKRLYQPDSLDCPANMVLWSQAACYCNWLSEREKIPVDQWCYEQVGENNGLPLYKSKPNSVELLGYRLPSSAEWEYTCGAGTASVRHFGDGDSLISEYSWWAGNTGDGRPRPVATKMPNPFGMFDMYGNVIEWCHDEVPVGPEYRLLRGLGAGDWEPDRTVPLQIDMGPLSNEQIAGGIGFRVAQTLD